MHGKHLSLCLAHDKIVVNSDSLVLIRTISHPHRSPIDAIQTAFFSWPLSHKCVAGERGRNNYLLASKDDVSIGREGTAAGLPSPHRLGPSPCVTLAMPSLEPSLDGSWLPSPESASPLPLPSAQPRPWAPFFFPWAPATSKQEGGFLVYFGLFYLMLDPSSLVFREELL